VDAPDPAGSTLTGGERAQLESFLTDARTEILSLLAGLTEEQASGGWFPPAPPCSGW